MFRLFPKLVLSAMLLPLPALAQDAPGGCRTEGLNVCVNAGSARLSAAAGDVLLSRGKGFAQISAGEVLSPGDRLLIKKGSANLALGPSCRTKLGPNSMVAITEKDGLICASPVAADASAAGADLPARR